MARHAMRTAHPNHCRGESRDHNWRNPTTKERGLPPRHKRAGKTGGTTERAGGKGHARHTGKKHMCQYRTGQPTCHGAENKVGLGDLSWAAQETSTPWQCAREPKSAATQYNAILGQSCQQAACQRQARGITCEESKTRAIPEVLATTRVELPNIIGFVSVHDQQLPVIGADPVCADTVCTSPRNWQAAGRCDPGRSASAGEHLSVRSLASRSVRRW